MCCIQHQCLFQALERLVQTALYAQRQAAVIPGMGESGIAPDRCIEAGQRFAVAPHAH